ncbi:dihydrofolate reductase [Patescibacteria group bacterium]|nr:dihydrofolate reductase [Patescibacteria group bacterium]
MEFSIIAAVDKNNGLGKAGTLVWRLKGDLEHFKAITTRSVALGKQNAVIMGSVTWLSLPEQFRPLPDRLNVVLNHHQDFILPAGVILATSFDEALEQLVARDDIGEIFVIGGASVYAMAIKQPACTRIYLTRIDKEFDCDVFFPSVDESVFVEAVVSPEQKEKDISYRFFEYVKIVE